MSGNDTYYTNMLGDQPYLTYDEEINLIERVWEGDEDAREELIRCNMPLVIRIASDYHINNMLDELISAGMWGLTEATHCYNPDKGRFSTWAVWLIKKRINETLSRMLYPVRIPTHASVVFTRIYKAQRDLQAAGVEPTPEILSSMIGKSLKSTIKYLRLQLRQGVAMDAMTNDSLAIDTIPRSYERVMPMPIIELLDILHNDIDRQIITLRLGLGEEPPLRFWEIGEVVNLSHQRVHQRYQDAIKLMKTKIMSYNCANQTTEQDNGQEKESDVG